MISEARLERYRSFAGIILLSRIAKSGVMTKGHLLALRDW